jgi:monoamine oxidase
VVASKVINWTTDPFTRGSYSYATVDMEKHMTVLRNPVEHTLFFAGEALYTGHHAKGTVEAALSSGAETASKLLTDE